MLTEQILIPLIPKLKQKAKKYTKDYEDLVQDTVLKAWIIKDKFTTDVVPLKFLYCIMKSINLDNKRKINVRNIQIPFTINYKYPNQQATVAFNECSKLPNFEFALKNALGYSLEDIAVVDSYPFKINIKRSSMYKAIKHIHSLKEEYV